MKPHTLPYTIVLTAALVGCGSNTTTVTAKSVPDPTTISAAVATTTRASTANRPTTAPAATTAPAVTTAPAATTAATVPEKGGKYGSPGGGTGSVSYAAMRGDVLEAWGNGGKVLEAVVCDTGFCNVQDVTATRADIYVAVSTTRPDGTSADSEVWRYPLAGGRAESIYRAANMTLTNVASTANGDIYVLESTLKWPEMAVRRIRNGVAADVISGDIQNLSASRSGTTVGYTVLNATDPSKYSSNLWILDAATDQRRQVSVDDSMSPNISVSADGTAVLHYNAKSSPVGEMSLRNLIDDSVITQAGSTGCLAAENRLVTWEYSETGITVVRGTATQKLQAFSSGETACRPDGALVGLVAPKTAPTAAVAVASEGDNGSIDHVCGVGGANGDLAVVRADGTTTRLGHDYHRIFQL
jgi:hypothetical protein